MTQQPSRRRFRTVGAAAAVALLMLSSRTVTVTTQGRYVSNLSTACMRCLCEASTACNASVGCSQGYCGPYYLYRDYWRDAGKLVLKDDDPDRELAFVDCATDAECARKVVIGYMAKYGRDCNKNGAADCDDYARVHFNGRDNCTAIEKTNFWKRYEACWPADGKGKILN